MKFPLISLYKQKESYRSIFAWLILTLPKFGNFLHDSVTLALIIWRGGGAQIEPCLSVLPYWFDLAIIYHANKKFPNHRFFLVVTK